MVEKVSSSAYNPLKLDPTRNMNQNLAWTFDQELAHPYKLEGHLYPRPSALISAETIFDQT